MSPETSLSAMLALLLLLQAKHLLADYVLQSDYILANRRRYGHPGGLLHAAIHMAGSTLAFLPLGGSASAVAAIILIEGLAHYHIDWAKDSYAHLRGLTAQDGAFWRAIGIDQFLHQITYLAMVGAWAIFAV